MVTFARVLIFSVLSILSRPGAALLRYARKEAETADVLRSGSENARTPKVFVSVLSARPNYARREEFRERWKIASLGERYKMKFMLCIGNDEASSRVNNESATYKDLVLVKCQEGAKWGQLAKKQLGALKIYDGFFSRYYQLFMQVEDDSFVAWHRLRRFLADTDAGWAKKHKNTTISDAYIGVPTSERKIVDRNAASLRYQPFDVYAPETYPIYMMRVGYLLGKNLVRGMIVKGVGDARMMANGDQAIGVWIDMVKRRQVLVRFVRMPGRLVEAEDQADLGSSFCASTWKDYPYIVEHGMVNMDANCMSQADQASIDSQSIGHCFLACNSSVVSTASHA